MGCCGKEFSSGSCVCDVLREIDRAQEDISNNNNCCDSSCDRSISDLLGETEEERNGLDTVPVILYCRDSCKPFKGYGAHPRHIDNLMSSFYFRVKSVDDDCCAVLELLKDRGCSSKDPHSPMEQETGRLRGTGICITVDVNCFCHITCLPAISAYR